jgi:thiaminase/transcriptional activator TenA
MLHEKLWQNNADLAEACLRHPFVQRLADGELSPTIFRSYIAQDAFFLRAFLKAYALAMAHSDELETADNFLGLISGVLEELKLHRRYSAELGIDLAGVVPNQSCRAYTDFLLRTAWHGTLAQIVAAMIPCLRLYAYLGGKLAGKSQDRNPYRQWIETYSSQEFGALARRLETLLDQVAEETPEVVENYRYAMQCELDFFSEAIRGNP